MEDQSESAQEAFVGLQERSMASRVEILQQVEELEQKMTDMSKELCESIKNLINEEFDNQMVFTTIELEYERAENAKKRIDRIQQMLLGFSCNTQNIFQRAPASSTTKNIRSTNDNACAVNNGAGESNVDDDHTKMDNCGRSQSLQNESTPTQEVEAKQDAAPCTLLIAIYIYSASFTFSINTD